MLTSSAFTQMPNPPKSLSSTAESASKAAKALEKRT